MEDIRLATCMPWCPMYVTFTNEWRSTNNHTCPTYSGTLGRLVVCSACYLYVMSHMWMSHFPHIANYMSCRTCECVMAHMREVLVRLVVCVLLAYHVMHMSESCHTCEWVMAHISLPACHATHVRESHHTCEWGLHIWMSRGTHVNESCHTCEWVKSQIWMSRGTHVNESCHTRD